MLSIIIPFHNEEENLPILQKELHHVLKKEKIDYELIFINDGSTDRSVDILPLHHDRDKVVPFKKRLGKGKALSAGFRASKGDVVICMDADLQDNPEDIPKFLKVLSEGYDFANGWRRNRKDNIFKTLPSSIFNFLLLKILLRSDFHDINCGFKAMRREVLETIPLYGDNYRFLPILAKKSGFKTAEVVVDHRKRMHGISKYGTGRLFSGLLDTLTTYFIYQFSEKPLHFFGFVGGILFSFGYIITLYLAVERIFFQVLLYRRPLLLFGILFIIVGMQIIMTGIIGELIVYLHKKKS